MQSSPVTVRVLGAVELVDSTGHVHPVPGRRMQALLARLVSEAGRVVSVDALTEAMWPEQSPEAPDAALRVFQAHRRHLADELGLEPSPRLRRLEAAILGGEAGPPTDVIGGEASDHGDRPPVDGLKLARLPTSNSELAWGELGTGSPVVVVPAWVSHLEVIAAGADPRSSLIEHLARNHRVIAYDRRGTGLSGGPVADFGLGPAVAELEAVLDHVGEPAALLAMSGAGRMASSSTWTTH